MTAAPRTLARHRQLLAGVVIGGVAMAGLAPAIAGTDDGAELIADKIAVAPQSERMPKDPDVLRMIKNVNENRIRQSISKMVSFGTRNTLSSATDPQRGIGAARAWVFDEFSEIAEEADGRMEVAYQRHTRTVQGRPVEVVNVTATLKGTQAAPGTRTYVVTGHLDTRCSNTNNAACDAPGANDDASGVAAVIEAARVMAPYEFDANIVFMAVSGEEQGLWGAESFAQQAVDNGIDIEGVLNLDVIGNVHGGNGQTKPNRVRVFSEGVPWTETEAQANRRRLVGGENDGPSRQLARYINTVAMSYTPDMAAWMVNRVDRFGRGGDHRPFLQRGFTAVRFSEPFENYEQQHQDIRFENGIQYGDLLQFVEFYYVARVNRLVVASLASLADAPSVPENARIITGGVNAYNTTVAWNASSEADIVGYEVVWRDSTSPVWTDSKSFGRVTRGEVINLPKDNTIIGVRAIDADGNKSPVALAR
jgi:hypothetical protein